MMTWGAMKFVHGGYLDQRKTDDSALVADIMASVMDLHKT
jgi:hypothetical protein